MSDYIDFNINHYVKVKLTKEGLAEIKRQDDELRKMYPSITKFDNPKVDEDGYSKFQLWDLMGRLGHLCHIGMNGHPFETDIKIQQGQ